MEGKKNNQVQALDDDALENVAGGFIVHGNCSKIFYYWMCLDCGEYDTNTYSPKKCEKCGSSNLSIRECRKQKTQVTL